ncbi:uncharacterized protein LOC111697314 [Eurytemora carolleeae]|uniref:uncharacterized protein LOC111697314 n=1 Tax=Eurytemora carolleeae TaxID=1294199 RepID=UPI000C755D4C|nr:uncharacterized protein LOC111697314 [Eurytemora carolleeae]|eukprot:XP_023323035.1 uncharacterized protein LOC111697314 [Eurytemora affinis]
MLVSLSIYISVPFRIHQLNTFNLYYNISEMLRGLILSMLLMSLGTHASPSSDAMLRDPAFLKCLEQNSGGDPELYYPSMVTCMGFAGRPRFGKRGNPFFLDQQQEYRIPNFLV